MKKHYLLLIRMFFVCSMAVLNHCTETGTNCSSDIKTRNGQVIRIPGLDLRKDGVLWGGSQNPSEGEEGATRGQSDAFIFRKGDDGIGYYKVDRSATSFNTIPLIPNRSYILSIRFMADFKRDSAGRTREVNIGLRTFDGGGKNIVDNLNGIPINKTNGWERWEWEFTTDQRVSSGRLHINVYGFSKSDVLKFADIAFIELPAKPLIPYNKGEGVTFRGGPGNLPMEVKRADINADTIIVHTTGAQYTFNLTKNTLTARQMLEKERDVSMWKFSTPFKGLEILRKNEKECILANSHITFGVQCDGLIMISPLAEVVLECESRIGGKWNRFAAGHLFCLDDWGGFAVNPDIPLGSGRLARVDAGIRTGRVRDGELDFSGIVDNKTFISSANPGWKVKWNISPGERIAISVFPPRPYPWKESFKSSYAISNQRNSVETYKELAPYCNHIIMWNFIQRGWGNSYTTKFVVRDDSIFKNHIEAIKANGMTACPYMSPYFFYSRDPEVFAGEVKRMKETYGINGVYFDGIPSQEWITAYEEMRMTREILKDGTIIVHNTGHASNGIPPLGEVSLKIPAVETYADITYGGELVWGFGPDWVFPRYIENQYHLANCIGTFKAGAWEGVKPYERDLILLKYNGRSCLLPQDEESPPNQERMEMIKKYYFPVLKELQKLWEVKGNNPEFYEKYYLPEFDKLTRKYLLTEQKNK
jgi:hypothetical protein